MKSNDKKRARVNAMRAFLSRFDYDGKDHDGKPYYELSTGQRFDLAKHMLIGAK